MSVSFYPCFPVANQKLHTKCLLWRRIKKNDNSPISRSTSECFLLCKKYSTNSLSTHVDNFHVCRVWFTSTMAPPDFETPANIQEQQMRNQSLVPKSCLEVPKCIYTMQLVGWVSLRFFTSPLACQLVWSGEASCWLRSCYCDCFDVSCDE